jgi:hypothetical protein
MKFSACVLDCGQSDIGILPMNHWLEANATTAGHWTAVARIAKFIRHVIATFHSGE